MKRVRLIRGILAIGLAALVAWPVLADRLDDARLVVAPDGVQFVIHGGVRYRVTPQPMSFAELGAIPEGPPLPVGVLAPPAAAPSPGPAGPQVVRPGPEIGLARERAIPIGWTCSCTIDRAGEISQFDITVVRVLQDAYPFLQQANRFNRPPRDGARYVGVLITERYIQGPEDQAYSVQPSDFRATASDELLRDPTNLVEPEPRLRVDFYPGSSVTGWVFFELPRDQPAQMVWLFSFEGERGVWFSLQ